MAVPAPQLEVAGFLRRERNAGSQATGPPVSSEIRGGRWGKGACLGFWKAGVPQECPHNKRGWGGEASEAERPPQRVPFILSLSAPRT